MQSTDNSNLTAMNRLAERAAGRIQADPRDFLPSLVRLQEAPPSPLGRRVLGTSLVFLVAVLLWATFGRLDIIAVADGKLVPDTYVKIVQPIDSGVVKEILVKEGEEVKTGQVLMRMDAMLSESDLKSLTADDKNKRIALRRIDAQLAGAPFTRRADEPAELFVQVFAQYLANRQAYENALAQERATLEKAQHDLAAAEQVQKKLAQTLPHFRAQEAAYEKLTNDGFAGRLMYTDKQRERIEHEQDLRAQESTIASAQSLIAQEEKKIAQIGADYRRQLQTERVDIAAQLEKAEQELAKQEHRQEYLELRAPQDGVVKDLATHTAGTVTSPGTILMTLVPKDEKLRAEVWVKNDDIGFVHKAQPVKIKLATFTFQKYGM
ncbi:MAG: HlyD family type I secretion periplasmic adaptor subunit, partial [Gemmatimonadales bacterium]|nr:HlyD family type I secretion periplasmic adaptor subunit [Gemmatimonadales bacterium]